ncbi:helix-turn-helix transcriptional regulator [Sphingobacterium yanglingense]|nr:helix-turn-helix transcriptional regulator [Sphingobacterium yanglingense]
MAVNEQLTPAVMIRSLIVQPQRYYPHARESSELPRGSSYRMGYAEAKSWQIDDSWCSIQWYKSKYILPYCIEVEAKEPLYLPITFVHPDIHWQYALKGGYGIEGIKHNNPILTEGQHHKLYAVCGDFTSYMPIGRHLIIGYSIAASWLEKHRSTHELCTQDISITLLADSLYHSTPAPITSNMLTELYYILEHPRIAGIQQDTNVYAAVGRLQSLHEQQENSDPAPIAPQTQIVEAIRLHIEHCLANKKLIPSIRELSTKYKISQKCLNKAHKKLYDMNLSQHISDRRLEEAALLLKSGSSVKEVTFILHYHDIPAFSNTFKDKYGVAPSQYQQ